jgi:flagellar basal body-associated protein FliL
MREIDPSRILELIRRVTAHESRITFLVAGAAVVGILTGAALFVGLEPGKLAWARGLIAPDAGPAVSVEPDAAGPYPVSAAKPAEEKAGHIGTTFSLDTFVVNIADRERDRYLKLKAELELEKPEMAQELKERLPQIRDLIISLLGGKSFDEVRTIEGKNFLREEMLLRINSLLVTGEVRRIFFTEFVVQ